jgi:hypothetical protein
MMKPGFFFSDRRRKNRKDAAPLKPILVNYGRVCGQQIREQFARYPISRKK